MVIYVVCWVTSSSNFFNNLLIEWLRQVPLLTGDNSMGKLVFVLIFLMVASALERCSGNYEFFHFFKKGIGSKYRWRYLLTSLDLILSLFLSKNRTYLACSWMVHLKLLLVLGFYSELVAPNTFTSNVIEIALLLWGWLI